MPGGLLEVEIDYNNTSKLDRLLSIGRLKLSHIGHLRAKIRPGMQGVPTFLGV
jgi:hypothetical protein